MTENNGSGEKILVVEDNEFNQDLIRRMTRRLGFDATVVQSGAEALEAVSADAYAVILMDCQMPSMNGYDVTRAIRRAEGPNQNVPIVAITADLADVASQEAFASGMNDFLAKPFELKDLEKKLNTWTSVPNSVVNPDSTKAESAPLSFRESFAQVIKNLELENDPKTSTHLIEKFIQNSKRLFDELQIALKENNSEKAFQVAHTCKGSSRSMGAIHLGDLWEKAQGLAKKGEIDAIQNMMADMSAEMSRISSELNTFK